jgi:6-phosphogluconolactonase
MNDDSQSIFAYIGTFTRGRSEGIYICRVNPASGEMRLTGVASGIDSPAYLATHPDRRHLYAVNEREAMAGSVTAFVIDQQTGGLTKLNQQPTRGSQPCHLNVDATRRFVLAVNYGEGSLCIFPVRADGSLGEMTDFVQHRGSSVNPERQAGPHAHQIISDPAGRFWFVSDLGLDKIMIYRLDAEKGKLAPNDPPFAQVHAGAGPRHLAFHPSARFAYVINELSNTVTAFEYAAAQGALREIQTISTLPEGYADTSYCSAIRIAPSGKFIYGSNRIHDSITIFRIDEATGQLTLVGHEPTRGHWPRDFAIDPDGAFLYAANQKSDTIVAFRIDPDTGRLTPTGHVIDVPMPACVAFFIAPPRSLSAVSA